MERMLDPIDIQLLDNWQRDFPVEPRPFARMASDCGLSETDVLERLRNLKTAGRISRVGATCAPNTVSASTLAALSAPAEAIEDIADMVGQHPGVNHSYLRENTWNLWFVATGPDRAHVDSVLKNIQIKTGLTVLDLRLVRPFNVDLGFKMTGPITRPPAPRPVRLECLQDGDQDILQALTTGMHLTETPYAQIAQRLDLSEEHVLRRITALSQAGIISRLGVIVRHRALGWRSNAMVVWNIEPHRIDAAGEALAAHPGITLCYERRPVEGIWPYRLYCMIHAQTRKDALDVLGKAKQLPQLSGVPHETLFSSRCFKQTGAMISKAGVAA